MAGQKGNVNALKHGIYAKRYTAEEQDALKRTAFDDLRHEIASLRVSLSKASVLLDKVIPETDTTETPTKTTPPTTESIIAYSKLLASIAAAATAINTLVRSHALMVGSDSELEKAIIQALNSIDPYLGDQ